MKKPKPLPKVCYAQMSKQFLRREPFEYVLCGRQILMYHRAVTGLKVHALEISLMKYILG